ncbi:MAG TPA: hypothetical protein VF251_01255 [Pyrinomonadaceae bacterium]
MNRKVTLSALVLPLTFILGVAISFPATYLPRLPLWLPPLFSDGGPIGYEAELVSSARSPDGTLLVKVFRQRNRSRSARFGAEMHAEVFDDRGKLLYREIIGSDGAWTELDNAFKEITFEGDAIRISHLWGRSHTINKSQLKRPDNDPSRKPSKRYSRQ